MPVLYTGTFNILGTLPNVYTFTGDWVAGANAPWRMDLDRTHQDGTATCNIFPTNELYDITYNGHPELNQSGVEFLGLPAGFTVTDLKIVNTGATGWDGNGASNPTGTSTLGLIWSHPTQYFPSGTNSLLTDFPAHNLTLADITPFKLHLSLNPVSYTVHCPTSPPGLAPHMSSGGLSATDPGFYLTGTFSIVADVYYIPSTDHYVVNNPGGGAALVAQPTPSITSVEAAVIPEIDVFYPPAHLVANGSNVIVSTGADIIIRGQSFIDGATVKVNGISATSVTVVNSHTVYCTAPAYTGTFNTTTNFTDTGANFISGGNNLVGLPAAYVDVTVTNPPNSYVATASNGLVYYYYEDLYTPTTPPTSLTLIAVVPDAGPVEGGNNVGLYGYDMSTVTSATFDGNPATDLDHLGHYVLGCVVPAGEGVVDVCISSSSASATLTAGYTYGTDPVVDTPDDLPVPPSTVAPLRLLGMSPSSGTVAGGTPVILFGTGMKAVTHATFAGSQATSIVHAGNYEVSCLTPAHAVGLVNVSINDT